MKSRENKMFTNRSILDWLEYYADNTDLDLERIKVLDITGKNRNLIPTVLTNSTTLVLTDAGHPDIFYSMWNAGLGDCEIWYNEGSDPKGPIKHDRLADMINRGINASAGMVICNPNASSTPQVGLKNERFSAGSIHYVGREIRSVIMNKLAVSAQDVICIISGESIAVEAAMCAGDGEIIAVEYDRDDREAMESNVQNFGLNNVSIIDNMEPGTLNALSAPNKAFIVATGRLESELVSLLSRNPKMDIVIYTLELNVLAQIPALFEKYGIDDMKVFQITVSKLNSKSVFETQPSPWIITGTATGGRA